ncbi:MAG: hypothetical protein Q8N53_11715 [Longimicrobiales bacterium]|nr:hypothetical protein [Longimicrobiales bacterium]
MKPSICCAVLPRPVSRATPVRGRASLALLALAALCPAPAAAQIGIYDALARRFSDVSFFVNTGALLPAKHGVTGERTTSYGIEVLLEIGGINRPASRPPASTDSVTVVWTGRQVTHDGTSADTVDTYDVRPRAPRPAGEPLWTFEVGIGYGQLTGFGLEAPELDMRGAVRDLPSVSLYASYEPLGGYLGVRSGFAKLQGLQIIDDQGRAYGGEAESFMAGVAIGEFVQILNLSLFVEGAYTWRDFPSVRWTGPSPLPAGVPRSLGLSGWTLGAGLQFGVGGG